MIIEPTEEQLIARFTKTIGGPNPYYECSKCGQEWPGEVSMLNDHYYECTGINHEQN